MDGTYLHGRHVYLRALEPEDLDFIYEVENRPEHWVMTDFTVPYSRFSVRQYLQDTRCDLFADKQLRLVIALCGSHTPIGTMDLFNYQPLHTHAEVGILVRQEHLAHVVADNEVSLRLFCSCGFVSCGLLKEWWRVDDVYKDVALLQRLNHLR